MQVALCGAFKGAVNMDWWNVMYHKRMIEFKPHYGVHPVKKLSQHSDRPVPVCSLYCHCQCCFFKLHFTIELVKERNGTAMIHG